MIKNTAAAFRKSTSFKALSFSGSPSEDSSLDSNRDKEME